MDVLSKVGQVKDALGECRIVMFWRGGGRTQVHS